MVKGTNELDMRGRCSAGQKVSVMPSRCTINIHCLLITGSGINYHSSCIG